MTSNEGVGTNWYDTTSYQSYLAKEQTAQTNYNAQQTNLTNDQSAYNSAKSALETQIAVVNGMSSSDSGYSAAQAQLTTDLNTFIAAETTYNSLLNTYTNTLSENLVTAKENLRNYIDTYGDSIISNFISEISSTIDNQLTFQDTITTNTISTNLNSANNARIAARQAFLTALTNYYNNQLSLSEAQNTLSQDSDNTLIAQANLALNPNNSSYQTAYNNAVTTQSNQQTTVNNLQSDATTLQSDLNSALTTLQTDMNNLSNVLQTAYTTASTTATNYSTAYQNAITTINSQMSSALTAKKTADTTALQTYLTNNPTNQSSLNSTIVGIQSTTAAAQSSTQSSGEFQISTVSVDFPQLPLAGQVLSLLDVMRFLGSAQVLTSGMRRQIQQANNLLNEFFMLLWQYEAQGLSEQSGVIASYYNTLNANDVSYDTKIVTKNAATYSTLSTEQTNFNSQITAINNEISQINQDITNQNTLGQSVTQDLNSTAYITRDLINSSGTIGPDITNLFDVQGLASPTSYPTQLGNPTVVAYPTSIPLLPEITPLPSVPAPTGGNMSDPTGPVLPALPAQSSIDAYNAAVAAINDELTPYASLLPSTVSLPLDQLYYDQYTPLRTTEVTSTIFSTLTFTLMEGTLNHMLRNNRTNPSLDPTLFAMQKLLSRFLVPIAAETQISTDSIGVAFSSIALDANTSIPQVLEALNAVMQSQQFQQLMTSSLEQAALTGALDISIQFPSLTSKYSIMGLVDTQQYREAKNVIDQQINRELLQAVVTAILDIVNNVDLLAASLQTLLPTLAATKGLSPQAMQQLLGLATYVQQFTLFLMALTLASSTLPPGASSNALLGPNPATFTQAQLDALISDLKSVGVLIQPTSIASTSLPVTLLQGIENQLNATDAAVLRKEMNTILAAAGLPTIAATQSLATGLQAALKAATPAQLEQIHNAVLAAVLLQATELYITKSTTPNPFAEIPHVSARFPESLQQRILALAQNIPLLNYLNPAQQVGLLVGLATGVISGSTAKNIVEALMAVKTQGINATAAPAVARDRKLRSHVREAFHRVRTATRYRKEIEKVTEDFLQFTVDSRDFGVLAVKLLLDPGQLMIRSFYLMTQDPTSKGNLPPLQIPISG